MAGWMNEASTFLLRSPMKKSQVVSCRQDDCHRLTWSRSVCTLTCLIRWMLSWMPCNCRRLSSARKCKKIKIKYMIRKMKSNSPLRTLGQKRRQILIGLFLFSYFASSFTVVPSEWTTSIGNISISKKKNIDKKKDQFLLFSVYCSQRPTNPLHTLSYKSLVSHFSSSFGPLCRVET